MRATWHLYDSFESDVMFLELDGYRSSSPSMHDDENGERVYVSDEHLGRPSERTLG